MILYPIFSRRIAYQLEKMGFKLIKIVLKNLTMRCQKIWQFIHQKIWHHSLKNLVAGVKKSDISVKKSDMVAKKFGEGVKKLPK